MRILFTRFPLESSFGGAEIQTLSLMEGLRASGHEVSFLGSCPVLLSECRKRDIKATELHIGEPPVTKWGSVSFLWRQRKMRRMLLEKLEELTADRSSPVLSRDEGLTAVLMLSLSEKLLITDTASALGVQVLWIEHDRIGRWLTWNPWLPRLRRLAKSARTVCVSHLSRTLYLKLGWPQYRTIVIPNGIDLSRWQAANSRLATQDSRLTVGTVARLSPEKGVGVLIDAVSALPDSHLTIIGRGKEEEALRARIARLNCGDRVTILAQSDDLPAFYESLDVFVLPSRDHDPFGLVAAEAMASGTATIVTDACGIAGELTDGQDALIVKAGDAQSLQKAIEKLRETSVRKTLSEGGIATAKKRFALGGMIAKYEGLLSAPPGTQAQWQAP